MHGGRVGLSRDKSWEFGCGYLGLAGKLLETLLVGWAVRIAAKSEQAANESQQSWMISHSRKFKTQSEGCTQADTMKMNAFLKDVWSFLESLTKVLLNYSGEFSVRVRCYFLTSGFEITKWMPKTLLKMNVQHKEYKADKPYKVKALLSAKRTIHSVQ